jgi:hypothetical protein
VLRASKFGRSAQRCCHLPWELGQQADLYQSTRRHIAEVRDTDRNVCCVQRMNRRLTCRLQQLLTDCTVQASWVAETSAGFCKSLERTMHPGVRWSWVWGLSCWWSRLTWKQGVIAMSVSIFMKSFVLSFRKGLKPQSYPNVPKGETSCSVQLAHTACDSCTTQRSFPCAAFNHFVFVMERECVYCEVRTASFTYYLQEPRPQALLMSFLGLDNGIFWQHCKTWFLWQTLAYFFTLNSIMQLECLYRL